MEFIVYLSDYIIPFIFIAVAVMSFAAKTPLYEDFVKGAASGLTVVKDIVPTLIGLMTGVGMLRASGALDMISEILKPLADLLHFPAELVPAAIVRMFSSSAATGLALDIFEKYGTDSFIGNVLSIMFSSTETIFYTLSVYYLSVRITKTRWTLEGALVSTFSGMAASVVMAGIMR